MPEPERPYDRRPSMPWDVRAAVDITVPSVARGYDYGLGGKNNFEVDRRAVDEILEDFPGVLELVWANRQFLRRGVEYLVGEAGITQLIEVGCGLPAESNVHEIAQAINPAARVVYTDRDASVVAHVRALLAHAAKTTVFVADAADPASILDDPFTSRFIDLDEPYAVLLAGVLHHLSDAEDPVGVTAYFRDRMPAGSYLLASNFLNDDDPWAADLEEAVTSRFGSGWFRPWETHRRFFAGLELVDPGLVYTNDWRPDERTNVDTAWHTYSCAGVGRKS